MADEVYFRGTTKKELRAFLATGVDAKGRKIRVWLFNWRGLKTINDLWTEYDEDDIELVRRADGRIVRYAWNVKVHMETPTRSLHEVKREYERSRVLWWFFWWLLCAFATKTRVLVKKQAFAISETRKRKERADEAAVRGVMEETGIVIPLDELKLKQAPQPIPPGDPTRESRVYADLLSLNYTEHFVWTKSDEFWESNDELRAISRNGIIIPDHNVLIYLEWFKKPAPPKDDGYKDRIVGVSRQAHVSDRDLFTFLRGDQDKFLNGTLTGPVFLCLVLKLRCSFRRRNRLAHRKELDDAESDEPVHHHGKQRRPFEDASGDLCVSEYA